MTKIDDEVVDPPAFPRTGEGFGDPNYDAPGMSLRDWFAGQALAGILATGAGDDDSQALRQIIAEDAYGYADAMLRERLSHKGAEI